MELDLKALFQWERGKLYQRSYVFAGIGSKGQWEGAKWAILGSIFWIVLVATEKHFQSYSSFHKNDYFVVVQELFCLSWLFICFIKKLVFQFCFYKR